MSAGGHVVDSPSNPHMSKSDAMYSDMLKELLSKAHQQLVSAHTKAVSILNADYQAQLHSLRCELETLRQQSGGGGASKSTKEAGTSDEHEEEDEGDGTAKSVPSPGSHGVLKDVKSVRADGRHENTVTKDEVWKAVKSVRADGSHENTVTKDEVWKAVKSVRADGSHQNTVTRGQTLFVPAVTSHGFPNKVVSSLSVGSDSTRGRKTSEEEFETSDGERSGSSSAQGGGSIPWRTGAGLQMAKEVLAAAAVSRFNGAKLVTAAVHTPERRFDPWHSRAVTLASSDFGLAGSSGFSFSKTASVPAPVSAANEMQAMTKQQTTTGAKTIALEFEDMDDKQCRRPPTGCKNTVTPDVSAGLVVQRKASLKCVDPLTRCDELVQEFRSQLKSLQLQKRHKEYKELVLTEFDEVFSKFPQCPNAHTSLTDQEYWKKYGPMQKTPKCLWLAVTRKYHAGTGDPLRKSDEFLHAMSMITDLWEDDPKPMT